MTELMIPNDPLIGQRANSLVLVQKLGEGGMGLVYRAEHPILGGFRAVKLLRPEFAAIPEVAKRFLTEARACRQLEHPRIIRIDDFGYLESGLPFFSMEFLVGVDLEKWCARMGRVPLPVILDILSQTADGLHMAHGQGVVHRDVKPPNIFLDEKLGLATFDSRKLVKVLDFGIAKVSGGGALPSGLRTMTGTVMGSIGFMAPEQARSAAHVDARADLFSLAAVAFFMTTGLLPFPIADDGGLLEYLDAVRFTEPARLRATLEAVVPTPSPGWIAAILRGLSVDPHQRPSSAPELIAELAAGCADGHGIVQRVAPDLMGAHPAAHGAASRSNPAIQQVSSTTGAHVAGALPTVPAYVGFKRRSWIIAAAGLGTAAVTATGIVLVARLSSDPRKPTMATTAAAPDAGADAQAAAAPVATTPPTPVPVLVIDAAPPVDAPVAIDAAIMDAARLLPDAGVPAIRKPPAVPVDPKERGELHVYTPTSWAEVYVGGKKLGPTPYDGTLPAGKYSVTILNSEGGKKETRTVTIRPGHPVTIELDWR